MALAYRESRAFTDVDVSDRPVVVPAMKTGWKDVLLGKMATREDGDALEERIRAEWKSGESRHIIIHSKS
jgi:hypothetical protein